MDTADGIPENAATFVVVPTIFLNELQVHQLVERLEVHYLANHDDQVYFALLSDFPDAESEETPTDSHLLAIAQSGIDALNQRHGIERFHLFHRGRQWNPGENKWMGWERKRGKLEEFNRLLRGANDTSFVVRTANDALLKSIRYVITLDSDTQLPRDVAWKLRVRVECDYVADRLQQCIIRSADDKAGVVGAAQQSVKFFKLAALA